MNFWLEAAKFEAVLERGIGGQEIGARVQCPRPVVNALNLAATIHHPGAIVVITSARR
jgi:hypothetical protein